MRLEGEERNGKRKEIEGLKRKEGRGTKERHN